MERPWHYTENQFLSATEGNYKKYNAISIFHDEALNAHKADPEILEMYNFYHPLHLGYTTPYNLWAAADENSQGNTQQVEDLLKEMSSTHVKVWDRDIQQFYLEGTFEYKALLPHGRGPFQSGSQQERIDAVKQLIINIGNDDNLAALKVKLQTFHATLITAQNTKLGKFSTVSTDSTAVEIARLAAGKGMYRNLGKLIAKHYETPEAMTAFFDLANLRKSEQTDFTGSVAPEVIKNIVKRTLEPDTPVTIKNDGQGELTLNSAADKTTVGAPTTGVNPGATKTVTAAELGNDADHPYINVRNISPTLPGHYELHIG